MDYSLWRRRAWLVGLVAGCASGCLGGQTGGSDSPPECADGPVSGLDPQADSPLGMRAAELLALLGGADEYPALWPAVEQAGSEPTDRRLDLASSTQARLQVRTVGGAARLVERVLRPALEDLGDPCPDRVDVDAQFDVEWSNPHGMLSGRFVGTLSALHPDLATFRASASPGALDGDPQATLLEGERVTAAELSVQLSSHGSTGRLRWVTERTVVPQEQGAQAPRADAPGVGPFPVERTQVLAAWPADSACRQGELAVALDRELLGTSAAQLLAELQTRWQLTWDDGSATPLQLSVEPLGARACLAPLELRSCRGETIGVVPDADCRVLAVPVRLLLGSQDGRLAGTVETELQAQLDDSTGLRSLRLLYEARFSQAHELEAATGLRDLGLHPGEEANFRFELQLQPMLGERSWRGEAEVWVPEEPRIPALACRCAPPCRRGPRCCARLSSRAVRPCLRVRGSASWCRRYRRLQGCIRARPGCPFAGALCSYSPRGRVAHRRTRLGTGQLGCG